MKKFRTVTLVAILVAFGLFSIRGVHANGLAHAQSTVLHYSQ